MRTHQRMLKLGPTIFAMVAATSVGVFAQPPGGRGTFDWISAELSVEARVVKRAPYSAQAVTEITQGLQDGNTIRQTISSSVYRDLEGRTRREQQLLGPGMLGGQTSGMQMVTITDPVANLTYMLRPSDRMARKMPAMPMNRERPGAPPSPGERAGRGPREFGSRATDARGGRIGPPPDRGRGAFDRSPRRETARAAAGGEPATIVTESLGLRVIEGVAAEGTRTIQTIPAGTLGNQRPIQIVTERWYSQELQVVVMTRHADPRVGETVYRLTNIIRAEPSPDLFTVPADYKVVDDGRFPRPGPARRD